MRATQILVGAIKSITYWSSFCRRNRICFHNGKFSILLSSAWLHNLHFRSFDRQILYRSPSKRTSCLCRRCSWIAPLFRGHSYPTMWTWRKRFKRFQISFVSDPCFTFSLLNASCSFWFASNTSLTSQVLTALQCLFNVSHSTFLNDICPLQYC